MDVMCWERFEGSVSVVPRRRLPLRVRDVNRSSEALDFPCEPGLTTFLPDEVHLVDPNADFVLLPPSSVNLSSHHLCITSDDDSESGGTSSSSSSDDQNDLPSSFPWASSCSTPLKASFSPFGMSGPHTARENIDPYRATNSDSSLNAHSKELSTPPALPSLSPPIRDAGNPPPLVQPPVSYDSVPVADLPRRLLLPVPTIAVKPRRAGLTSIHPPMSTTAGCFQVPMFHPIQALECSPARQSNVQNTM